MKRLSFPILMFVVSACSTPLTQEGMMVRQIPVSDNNGCKFLGVVTGSESMGLDTAMDAESALNKVRNDVAARGGNAFVLNNMATNYDSSVAQAEAYRC